MLGRRYSYVLRKGFVLGMKRSHVLGKRGGLYIGGGVLLRSGGWGGEDGHACCFLFSIRPVCGFASMNVYLFIGWGVECKSVRRRCERARIHRCTYINVKKRAYLWAHPHCQYKSINKHTTNPHKIGVLDRPKPPRGFARASFRLVPRKAPCPASLLGLLVYISPSLAAPQTPLRKTDM